MTNDKNRKPFPRAEVVWNVEGKKHPKQLPRTANSEIADFAMRLCFAQWQVPDGETSSGDQKYRALTPQEVVEHSIATAELMFSELESRGHVVFLPPHDQWPNDSGPMGFTP
jgi:hypothetical protein